MKKKKMITILFISAILLSIKVSAETVESTLNPSGFGDMELLTSQSQELFSEEEITTTIDFLKVANEDEGDVLANLVSNGDFSKIEPRSDKWSGEKPENWGIWIPSEIKTTDYIAQVNGDKQLILSSENEEFRAAVTQKFNIDPSKAYELSFKIKTDDLTNIARVRINEQNKDGQVNLWYSKSIKGTNDWQDIIQEFEPNSDTRFITIELFYEKGTGTLYYDDIIFVEKDNQNDESTLLEDKIEIHTNNIYLPKQENYTYVVSEPSILKQEKGLFYPMTEGETTIKIFDAEGEFVKEIPLIVHLFEESKYDNMLNQWNDVIAGNKYYDNDNQAMVQQNLELDDAVKTIISLYAYKDNPKILWDDITDYSVSANLTTSYRRIETVAKQVTQPLSEYYQNPDIIRIAKNAMEWMNAYAYNEGLSIKGNWWDYEIGVPRAMNNSLSLMKQFFTQSEILKYTNAINYFVPDPYYFRVTMGQPFKALGGNLIDMGRVKIISGALREDSEIVSNSIESLQQAFEYANPGEAGFFEDGSYIDHDNVALTGAYGNVLIDGLSQLLPVVIESGLLPANKLDNLYHFIDDSFLPLLYKGEMMDMTRGRAISRQELQSHAAGGEVLRGLMRIAESSEEGQKKRLNTLIKTMVKQNTYYDVYQSLQSYKDIDLMDKLLADISIVTTSFPSRLTVFNEMSKISYQNTDANFGIGLSMYSDKTQNYEYMNQENAHGWYTSDGAVYLYNDDLSHYNDNYWATVDPYRIPGTTIIPREREAGSGMMTSPNSFVGGTKVDDKTAAVAMKFTNWDTTLNANKSWFIFNDKIVFLGSDIQTTGEIPAITTIENRKNNENVNYQVLVNGEKINGMKEAKQLKNVTSLLLDSPGNKDVNIGYTFLETTSLNFTDKVNQGQWKEINAKQSDEVYENNFLTFYQTHSSEDTTYSYVMYPNISVEKLAEEEVTERVKVLQNDAAVQAAYDDEERSWGIVLYEDQSFKLNEEVTVTKEGVYSVKKEADGYILSYYHPTLEFNFDNTVKSSLTKEIIQNPTLKDKSTILHLYSSDTESSSTESSSTESSSTESSSTESSSTESSSTESSSTESSSIELSNKSSDQEPKQSNNQGKSEINHEKKFLPKTGEVLKNPIFQIVGIILVSCVIGFRVYYRK